MNLNDTFDSLSTELRKVPKLTFRFSTAVLKKYSVNHTEVL